MPEPTTCDGEPLIAGRTADAGVVDVNNCRWVRLLSIPLSRGFTTTAATLALLPRRTLLPCFDKLRTELKGTSYTHEMYLNDLRTYCLNRCENEELPVVRIGVRPDRTGLIYVRHSIRLGWREKAVVAVLLDCRRRFHRFLLYIVLFQFDSSWCFWLMDLATAAPTNEKQADQGQLDDAAHDDLSSKVSVLWLSDIFGLRRGRTSR